MNFSIPKVIPGAVKTERVKGSRLLGGTVKLSPLPAAAGRGQGEGSHPADVTGRVRSAVLLLMFTAILLPSVALADEFRFERSIQPAQPGPNRMTPDVHLLGNGRPLRYEVSGQVSGQITEGEVRDQRVFSLIGGLEDLRIFDSGSREVPYLLIGQRVRKPDWTLVRVLSITPTKTSSGIELDFGRMIDVDRLKLEGLRPVKPSPDFSFLKKFRLEGSGNRQRWTLLDPEATVFNLPDERLRRLEIAFTPGEFRYLRIVWDDRSSPRMDRPSSVSVRSHDPIAPAIVVEENVRYVARPRNRKSSRYRITLPSRSLPVVALKLRVKGGNVLRRAAVLEGHIEGAVVTPVEIGSSTLRRAERYGGIAEDLRIPIQFPTRPELDLVIDDGDNLPLEITGITAEFAPLPVIYFESPSTAPVTARYGQKRLEAPRYDLEVVRGRVDTGRIAEATWGEPGGAKRESAPEDADSAIPSIGSAVDPKEFRYRRSIPSGRGGLTSLQLDPAVLAHSRSDLRDVRVVDGKGRQVAYIVERTGESLRIPLKLIRGESSKGDVSRYEMVLPFDSLPGPGALLLTTSASLFKREITVSRPEDRSGEREESQLASATWQSIEAHDEPPQLELPISLEGTSKMIVSVDEGDNTPLPIISATLLIDSTRLRFFHPPDNPLRLLYGNAKLNPPRYDLALIAPSLLSEPAREVALDPEGTGAAKPEGKKTLFWIALIAVVVILVGLLIQLLRKQDAPVASSGE